MIGPGANVRVYLACGVTDMRKGIDGLAALVQSGLRQTPTSGAVLSSVLQISPGIEAVSEIAVRKNSLSDVSEQLVRRYAYQHTGCPELPLD